MFRKLWMTCAMAGVMTAGMATAAPARLHRRRSDDRLVHIGGLGSKILVLGLAYKKNIDDPRESPSFEIIELLIEQGASVSYHDPHVPSFAAHGLAMRSVPLRPASYDCVAIVTDHHAIDYEQLIEDARLIVDLRNATGAKGTVAANVFKL